MPFTKFTNLDFDQIKTSIKDYLRANSTFTDFDFEGSNFSILIDTLAYNTYTTAFNSNMVVNESFLDSATLRENVVSLARNIGYVPRSTRSAQAVISFSVPTTSTGSTLTLNPGLVCVGSVNGGSYVFSITESITVPITSGIAKFNNISVYEGTYLTQQFTYDGSLDQRFILSNPNIDTSTLVVYVKGPADTGLGIEYSLVDDIINVGSQSEIYLIQEVQDEEYQLLFGDGVFGKKLVNGSVITAAYIISDGLSGNGAKNFSYSGSLVDNLNNPVIPNGTISITTNESSSNGSNIEPLDSIKYYSPKIYSSQYRAVTARDYEAIIPTIYPNTESVSIVGGEELNPPQYGVVQISIKPTNGVYVSDFDKTQILSKLKQYSLSGIRQEIVDLQLLNVEIESYVYYTNSQVSSVNSLHDNVVTSLTTYANSIDLNTFGGRFKYSKVLQIIDNTDTSITSNITRVRIRRDLVVSINQNTQYELCYGNAFHIDPDGHNIKSTGFTISTLPQNNVVYFTDFPNKNSIGNLDGSGMGIISIIQINPNSGISTTGLPYIQVIPNAGTINYMTGSIYLNPINIVSTEVANNIIEIQAYPESNDVVGLNNLYIYFDISKSSINMVKDTISSGQNISGTQFTITSSYPDSEYGQLTRVL
jgi:hypothetical protein